MKCSVVLLSFLITVVYSHPHSNSSGFPAIFWGGERITESKFDISEWWSTPDKVLECHTDLSTCCSNTQGFHRGDWYFPDGTRAKFRHETKGPVYQSRGDKVVSLHRRGDNVELGEYCCKVETEAEHRLNGKSPPTGQRVCIDISNATAWCKNITWFQNGNAEVSGYRLNDTVTFTCNDGFELVGPSTGFCKPSGRWGGWESWSWEGTPDHPHCSVCPGQKVWNECASACPSTCDDPNPRICTLQCVAKCVCPDGMVERGDSCISISECPSWCKNITWFRNGNVEVSGNRLNDTVTFTCDDGFELVGPSTGVCQPSREWGGWEWWWRGLESWTDWECWRGWERWGGWRRCGDWRRWGSWERWSRHWAGQFSRPHCKGCADKLVVQAFTSGIAFGHSNGHHRLFISLKNGKNATIDFYNREGDDMAAHKGDIWALDLSETELPCFDFHDVNEICIEANSNDGWNIESVTTMLGVNAWHDTRWALLTVDMDANFWIDANAGEDRKRHCLTRVWWHPQCGPTCFSP